MPVCRVSGLRRQRHGRAATLRAMRRRDDAADHVADRRHPSRDQADARESPVSGGSYRKEEGGLGTQARKMQGTNARHKGRARGDVKWGILASVCTRKAAVTCTRNAAVFLSRLHNAIRRDPASDTAKRTFPKFPQALLPLLIFTKLRGENEQRESCF
jgi:hypothetical protein